MCSICGGTYSKDIIKKASHRMLHRGPNFSGLAKIDNVCLSHNRLSIIDLDDEANQPFGSSSYPHLTLVFNGEIYNYLELKVELEKEGIEFKTKSDTEVLLAMYAKYGAKALQKFNGDFSFVIYDKRDKSFFMARDRLGNKPLFYTLKNSKFAFASEIKGLLEIVGVEFDMEEVSKWLLFGSGSCDNRTIYKDILEFPKAHYGIYRDGMLSVTRYWDLQVHTIDYAENEAIEALESLLLDSLKLRLRSDVSIAMTVSGGIDSTILAYLGKKTDLNFSLYGLGFSDFGDIDESYFIDKLSKDIDVDINIIDANLDSMIDDFSSLVEVQDEIFRSFSIYSQFLLFREISKKHKVVIGGQGADELFGGYYHHVGRYIFQNREELENRIRLYGKEAISEYEFGLKCSLSDDIKLKLFEIDNSYGIDVLKNEGFAVPNLKILLDRFKPLFDEGLLLDTLYFNLPNLLRYEDRNSMHFSMENRTPFTDFRVVEFAFSLDSSLKFKNGYSKYILRKLLERYGMNEFAWRLDKKGFSTPEIKLYSNLFNKKMNSLFDVRFAIFKELSRIKTNKCC